MRLIAAYGVRNASSKQSAGAKSERHRNSLTSSKACKQCSIAFKQGLLEPYSTPFTVIEILSPTADAKPDGSVEYKALDGTKHGYGR